VVVVAARRAERRQAELAERLLVQARVRPAAKRRTISPGVASPVFDELLDPRGDVFASPSRQ
jgi:hypothetical protein